MASVVNSIEISAKETLHCKTVNKSLHGAGKTRQVIGWNEEVWAFRDAALFWHSIWRDPRLSESSYLLAVRKNYSHIW